jgi:hypothetical protein
MDRHHLDIAIVHYAYWHALGLTHRDMLWTIGIDNPDASAGDVVVAFAEMSLRLEEQLRQGETCRDAA